MSRVPAFLLHFDFNDVNYEQTILFTAAQLVSRTEIERLNAKEGERKITHTKKEDFF